MTIYKKEPRCKSCVDYSGYSDELFQYCDTCRRNHKEKVTIIKVGVGIFGNKAIVKRKNGELLTVSISNLIEEG